MTFTTEEERTLWATLLTAYIQNGGSTAKGAHLKFADRCIEAYRNRRVGPLATVILGLKGKVPNPEWVARVAVTAMDKHPGKKIMAIKEIREVTNLGLKFAKLAADLVESSR